MENIQWLPVFNTIGVVTLWGFVALMVITRKLVWHKDLEKEQARGDKWEAVALRLLGVSEKLTVSAEVASDVLTRLPVAGDEMESGERK